MFVALVIQHAMRMRHIAICACPDLQYFFHIISYTKQFSEKKIEHGMCALIISTTFVSNISHSKKK